MKRLSCAPLALALAAALVTAAGCRSTTEMETFRSEFFDLKGNPGANAPALNDFRMRSNNWRHTWRCNVFDSCRSSFNATVFVFDERTGRQVKWNRVEVYPKDDCNASTEDRRNYKTVADVDSISLGWEEEREGKFDRISTLLVFYADWGSVKARVRSLPCP